MRINSRTSGHRWYFLMILQSRLFLQLGEWIQIPGWLQVFVCAMPCMIPEKTLMQEQYVFDICEDSIGHWVHCLDGQWHCRSLSLCMPSSGGGLDHCIGMESQSLRASGAEVHAHRLQDFRPSVIMMILQCRLLLQLGE